MRAAPRRIRLLTLGTVAVAAVLTRAGSCREGCGYGYLYTLRGDGDAPRKVIDVPVSTFLGWMPR